MSLAFYGRLGEQVNLASGPEARIIHAETSVGLFDQIGEKERLLSYREIVDLRIAIYNLLKIKFPQLTYVEDCIVGNTFPKALYTTLAEVKFHMWQNTAIYAPWMDRYTTSTNIVRVQRGVVIADYQLKVDYLRHSIDKGLKDGGLNYDCCMDEILERAYTFIDYEQYSAAKGGALEADQWLEHVVLSGAYPEASEHATYLSIMDILSSDSFHKPGYHSAWIQSGFPVGYGRPIAAGFGEAAFYPPNNSTINHSGIVVPI